jgi:hypothetical protein
MQEKKLRKNAYMGFFFGHCAVFLFYLGVPPCTQTAKNEIFFSYVCKGSGFAPLRYRFGAIALLLASHGYNP